MTEVGDKLVIYVNGEQKSIAAPQPSTTLLQYLRNKLGLTGTKNGCDQGGCGACTVMTSWWDPSQKIIRHKNINACTTPLCYLHGNAVTTIEGVSRQQQGLHPLQESMVACHGIQCGYCTPGMIMSVYTLTQTAKEPSQEQLEQALEGNLCRCTGYRPIIESFKPLCKEGACGDIEDILKAQPCEFNSHPEKTTVGDLSSDLQSLSSDTVRFVSGDMVWIRPITLQEVVQLMQDIQGARLVMGATAIVYYMKKGSLTGNTLICCSHVKEMNVFLLQNDVLEVGGAVDLTTLENHLDGIISTSSKDECNTSIHALRKCLRLLGSDQIRNVSTIGGHIALCDPRSDLYPVLMALGAKAVIATKDGQSEVLIDEDLVSGPWKTSLQRSDIIVSMKIPINTQSKTFYYKQSKRKSFDYAVANACFSVTLSDETVTSARLFFGGIGPTFTAASNTANLLVGKKLNSSTFGQVRGLLSEDLERMQKGIENKFKLQLSQGFFRKFWNQIAIDTKETAMKDEIRDYGTSTGTQVWETLSPTQPEHDAVGKPIPILSGRSLVSGAATFVSDIPRHKGEIWVELIGSTKAHAKIMSIDVTKARRVPGVIDCMDASWIPGPNEWGVSAPDDVLFATSEV